MNISKKALYLLKFVALSGMFSVLFGAWLAHSQSTYLPKALESLTTAHQYQVYHTLALLFIVAMYKEYESKALLYCAASFNFCRHDVTVSYFLVIGSFKFTIASRQYPSVNHLMINFVTRSGFSIISQTSQSIGVW